MVVDEVVLVLFVVEPSTPSGATGGDISRSGVANSSDSSEIVATELDLRLLFIILLPLFKIIKNVICTSLCQYRYVVQLESSTEEFWFLNNTQSVFTEFPHKNYPTINHLNTEYLSN